MTGSFEVYRSIAPDLTKVVEERYAILLQISYSQPIGRRLLGNCVPYSERIIRSHVEVMKENGLLDFTPLGMVISEKGRQLLGPLGAELEEANNLSGLAKQIKDALGLQAVYIAQGDSDNVGDRLNLYHLAARVVLDSIRPQNIIAVSGGGTMAGMAQAFPVKRFNSIFIPARGGIGEHVELQANVIASVLAEKTGSQYKMLHLPDGLSPQALDMLVSMEPQVKEIADLSEKTDVLVFGIGDAMQMADQRGVAQSLKDVLREGNAVGEALGYYCNESGHIIFETHNVGISLPNISGIPQVIALAGGKKKAKAIIGITRAGHYGTLVTDEGAAHEIDFLLNS